MMTLLTLAGVMVCICVFWWAMIEAQGQANKEARRRQEAEWEEAINDAKNDDRRGDCPQCQDPDASFDAQGDVMCVECGLGCEW